MIVVDEAHELSKNQVKKLSGTYNYKLGLSATPERHSRLETQNIVNYFTNGIDTYKYSIDEAIENNFLSHYEYHPIFINLIDEEFEICFFLGISLGFCSSCFCSGGFKL